MKSSNGSCHILYSDDNRLGFCEDGTFWDLLDDEGKLVNRKIIATCDHNRESKAKEMGSLGDPNLGALWLVRFDDNNETAHELKLLNYPDKKDFHPLGVQIWPSTSGSRSNMFVVNHKRHKTTFEQFVIDPAKTDAAKFVRTITSRYFISPNALALTSPTSFFVSNDHLLTPRLRSVLGKVLPMVETISGLPLAFVSHVSIINDTVPDETVIRHGIVKLGVPIFLQSEAERRRH